MTPLSKMVTVSLNTGVGECMELMRTHQIRHLPVMATETGEDRNQALQNLKSVAERGEASARKQFTPYKAKLKDIHGYAPLRSGVFQHFKELGNLICLATRDRPPLYQPGSCAPLLDGDDMGLGLLGAAAVGLGIGLGF